MWSLDELSALLNEAATELSKHAPPSERNCEMVGDLRGYAQWLRDVELAEGCCD